MGDKMHRRPNTDLDVPGRPNSMQTDQDMLRSRRNAETGVGIHNEDDIDLGIDAEMDENLDDETRR